MGYDEGPQVKESKVKCKRKVERDPRTAPLTARLSTLDFSTRGGV
jgi:hypothetical protein